jgi:hypothetical protein
MKRIYFRMLVVSLFVASIGVAAQADEPDRLLVNIPCDFVVSGRTLPAGTYLVSRVSDSDLHEIAISSVDTGSTVLTLSAQVQDTSRIQPKITLQHSGDQNFLSKIQTANHVFTIEVPKSAVADAAAKAGGASYQTVTAESSKR